MEASDEVAPFSSLIVPSSCSSGPSSSLFPLVGPEVSSCTTLPCISCCSPRAKEVWSTGVQPAQVEVTS